MRVFTEVCNAAASVLNLLRAKDGHAIGGRPTPHTKAFLRHCAAGATAGEGLDALAR